MKKVLFNSWKQIYITVLLALLAQIMLFYWISKTYN